MVNTVHDSTVGIFDHMSITYSLDIGVRIKYIECTLKGAALNKFSSMIVSYKENISEESSDNWILSEVKDITMEYFGVFSKVGGLYLDIYVVLWKLI